MSAHDTNLLGTVHGGVVMKLVDDAAGAAAARHSEGPAVTGAMDEMAFLNPVRVGDLLQVMAQVTGRAPPPWRSGCGWSPSAGTSPARASRSPAPTSSSSPWTPRATAPGAPVLPENDRDRRRWQEAQIRRTHRLARRRAILELRSRRTAEGLDG